MRSGRFGVLCVGLTSASMLAGVGAATSSHAGTRPSARPAPPQSATSGPLTTSAPLALAVPADVQAAVAAGPVDVLVTVDGGPGLRQIQDATRTGLSRSSRQSATDSSAAAYAAAKRSVLRERPGLRSTRDYGHLPIRLVRVDSLAVLAALASSGGITSMSLPARRTFDALPNLDLIRQPEAQLAGLTGAGTRVAVLDSGIDYTAVGATTTFGNCSGGPATGTCRVKEYVDVVGLGGGGVFDFESGHHGTNVAGVVATVASAADLSIYAVGDDFGVWDSDVLTALDQVAASAAASNTRSVNLSLGASQNYHSQPCSTSAYAAAFATLRGLGVIPVVAAGNDASVQGVFRPGISNPACVPGAVSVGAVYPASSTGTYVYGTDCQDAAPASDQVACFSQTGPLLSIVAPGVSITAAGITMTGTSQATPHVAAAVAILAAANPAANAASIVNALTSSGPVMLDGRTGPPTSVHRLDLMAAVAAVSTATVPDAPLAVLATAGNGSVSASWQAGASNGGSLVTGYTATASPGGLACSTTGLLTCVISGLPNGAAVTVTVTATNAAGSSAASASSLAVTPVGPPAALPAPTAIPGNALVTVAWVAGNSGGSPITSFRVTASSGGSGCTSVAASCVVTGLANGTAYTFTVTATNAVGTSAASAPSAAVVPATVPGAPAAPTGKGGDRQVTVSWASPANTGGSAPTAYKAVANPGGAACSTAALSCSVAGLVNGKSYTFVVTATNAVGVGAPSAASLPVLAATVPAQPIKVSAWRGHLLAVVTWTAPNDGGRAITGYRVVASPGGRSCTTAVATRCTVTGLIDGRAYGFKVTASNRVGTGAASAASRAVLPAQVPAMPGMLTVIRGNARATVTWVAPAPNGTAPVTGYRVVATPGGRSCTSARVPRCTVTGLVNGRRYEFAVVALNRVGASPPTPGTAAIPATVPGAVRSLRATYPAAARTVLSWVAPASSGGLPTGRYEVRTSADNGRTWSRWASVGRATSALIGGLRKGRAYVTEVRAVSAAGAGGGLRLGVRPTV